MTTVGKMPIEQLMTGLSGTEGEQAYQQSVNHIASLDAGSVEFDEIKAEFDKYLGEGFSKTIATPAQLITFVQTAHETNRAQAAQSQVSVQASQAAARSAPRPTQSIDQAADQIFDQNTTFAEANKGKRPAGERELLGTISDLQSAVAKMNTQQKSQMRQQLQTAMQPGKPLYEALDDVGGVSEISRLLMSNLPLEMLLARIMNLLAGEADEQLRKKLTQLDVADSAEKKIKTKAPPAVQAAVADAEKVEAENEVQQTQATIDTAVDGQKTINQAQQPETPVEKAVDESKDKEEAKQGDARAASTSGKVSVDNTAEATPTVQADESPAPVTNRQSILQEIQYLQSRRSETMSLLNNIMQQLHQMAMDIIQKIGR